MTEPKILTRRELYDLIWARPMRDVAAELGISDVGLAKVCKRHRVPKPERGYWARVQAGQTVKKAVFVETKNPAYDRIVIHGALTQLPEAARQVVEKARAERRGPERRRPERQSPVASLAPVADPHPAIRKTVRTLRKARPDASGAVRAWGEGLCGVEVSKEQVERAISFLDALARGLQAKGLHLKPTGQAMTVADGPDDATFRLKERTRNEKHIPTEAELAAEDKRRKRMERTSGRSSWDFDFLGKAYPEFDLVYTGELVFQIDGYSDGVRRRWADGKMQTVETLFDSIVVGIEVLLATRKATREEREERHRQWQEMARRRELARQRKEREERRLTYLRSVLDLSDELSRLRNWLKQASDLPQSSSCGEHLSRLIGWAEEREKALTRSLDVAQLDADVRSNQLFPVDDPLYDPLGEPTSMSWY